MTDQRRYLLLGVLAFGISGCASSGGSSFSAMRPTFGLRPTNPSQTQAPQRRWNGPLVQPGTGLQPTPAMQPPIIQPGPALPDASSRKYRMFPESAATRRGYNRRPLPPVVPFPHTGAPIARQPAPSTQRPAELSGEIEIIPGPTLRARRARMELLPPPPGEAAGGNVEETSRAHELSAPDQGQSEAVPPTQ